ncbi:MAG: TIGR03617 family F420-dependent LLM class oxidoreductase [Acidimicrobiales bacterium]
MRVDTALFSPHGAVERAAHLRRLGFDGVFTFEGPHDVFHPLAMVAGAGIDLDLWTNVAIAFPRNPIHLAHAAWDLADLTGGRFALGLGTQVRTHITERFGVPFDRPVARMRELIEALRAIFAAWQDGTRLDVRGEFYTHTRMSPMFSPQPLPTGPPPIHVGALGPQMTRMVAGQADGLLVMPFNSQRHLDDHVWPNVAAGLARAGRDDGDLTVVVEAIAAVGRDDAEQAVADAGTRALLAFYGSTPAYRPVLEAHGWGDLQPELQALTRSGAWDTLPDLIDDEVLATIAVRGTPDEVAAQLRGRFGDRPDRLALYTPYAATDDLLGELVDAIHTA